MIQFLVFITLISLTVRFLFRLFGGMLLQIAVQRTMERMQKQYVDTENKFQKRYESGFEREILISPNVKVKMPRDEHVDVHSSKRLRRPIDDVDFEESRF